jgi:hypothetical protein
MAARAWEAGAVGGGVLLVLAAACRQLVGIGDEPPTDLADAGTVRAEAGADADAEVEAGPTGITYAGAQCEACVQTHCTPQATACAGETACSQLEGCAGKCDGGDPTCRAKCVELHRIGPDPFETGFEACLATNCASPCGITCGSVSAFFGADAAPACASCFENNATACNAGIDCAKQAGCMTGGWCIEVNNNPDRQQTCLAAIDAGRDALHGVNVALLGSCLDQCAVGDQWYCVGHVTPPPSTGQPTTLNMSLYDTQSPTVPVAGATVSLCAQELPPCHVVTSATSGSDGGLTLTVPNNVGGAGATGFLSITGTNLLPELYYWSSPLSELATSLNIATLTQTETSGFLMLASSQVGVPIDLSSHGLVTVFPTDCQGTFSGGVFVSISSSVSDPTTRVVYFNKGLFSFDAGSSPNGIVAIVNVPPGPFTLTATPRALGVPSSTVQGYAVKNTATVVFTPVNE